MKIGPSDGNSGAMIRWGKYWEHGVWIRGWNFKRLWFRWNLKPSHRYYDFGFICFQF